MEQGDRSGLSFSPMRPLAQAPSRKTVSPVSPFPRVCYYSPPRPSAPSPMRSIPRPRPRVTASPRLLLSAHTPVHSFPFISSSLISPSAFLRVLCGKIKTRRAARSRKRCRPRPEPSLRSPLSVFGRWKDPDRSLLPFPWWCKKDQKPSPTRPPRHQDRCH